MNYFKKDKKGQIFVGLILITIALIMFIVAVPLLNEIIQIGASQTGSASGFLVKLIMWVMLIVIIAAAFKVISSGEGFF